MKRIITFVYHRISSKRCVILFLGLLILSNSNSYAQGLKFWASAAGLNYGTMVHCETIYRLTLKAKKMKLSDSYSVQYSTNSTFQKLNFL